MIWTATAPGKLILLGEYAVLEGAPALVGAVARRARVSVSNRDEGFRLKSALLGAGEIDFFVESDGKVRFPADLSPEEKAKLQLFRVCVEECRAAVHAAGMELSPVRISLDTEAFFLEDSRQKLGLGSSAALTVSLIAVLMARFGLLDSRLPDKPMLLERAMSAHRKAQSNTGSGVDVAASVYGGVFQYRLNGKAGQPGIATRPFHLPPDLLTVAVWSGKSASTPKLVGTVNRLKDVNPEKYSRIMTRMKKLSQTGIGAIRNSDTSLFLKTVSEYFDAMADLGEAANAPIISAPHREISAICRKSGVQYKPSGAGGGDLGILFSREPERIRAAVKMLEQAGFPAFDLQIGTHGIQIQATKKEQ
ncbi:MAG: hypothetical protein GXO69_08725 [Acidobacteria bacterium]|nr:hypothetical protein [Acidobacteriota bacterium]